jgi:hypothetical protein
MPPPVSPLNPLSALDPNSIIAAQQAQQAQAYAQALREQAMSPIQGFDSPVGSGPMARVAKMSPLLPLAKVFEGYLAGKEQDKANDLQVTMAQRQGALLQSMFGVQPPGASPDASSAAPPPDPSAPVGQPTGGPPSMSLPPPEGAQPAPVAPPQAQSAPIAPGATVPAAPVAMGRALAGTAPTAGGPMTIPGMDPKQAYLSYMLDPNAYVGELLKRSDNRTDFTKLLDQAGITDPNVRSQLMQAQIAKQNNIPLDRLTANGFLTDGQGHIVAAAPNQNGQQPIIGPDGTIIGYKSLPGYTAGVAAKAAAEESGKNSQTPTEYWDPDANGGKGAMVFGTKGQVVAAAGAPPVGSGSATAAPSSFPRVSAAAQSGRDTDRLKILTDELAREQARVPNGADDMVRHQADLASLQSEIARIPGAPKPMLSAPPPGMVESANTAAKNDQNTLSEKTAQLSGDMASAPTVIARLQTIKNLAPKAILGAENDRRDFFNGLLSLAGIQGATDSKTASDLVDKNSAQIVAAMRMGASGGGTDAFQTLAAAGNPARHMTAEAVNEAVDQLESNQRVNQARAQALLPLANGKDPVAYRNAEAQFNAAADPRIFQWQAMPPDPVKLDANGKPIPGPKSKFAAQLLKDEPTTPDKIKYLHSLGVIQ